jgi:hypothetical protein
LLALRQQVPQNFTEPDRGADCFGHMSLMLTLRIAAAPEVSAVACAEPFPRGWR